MLYVNIDKLDNPKYAYPYKCHAPKVLDVIDGE